MFSKGVRSASPYRRLKLAMDYWCSLWFWPIEQADLLPSRAEYLLELSLLLEGNLFDSGRDESGQLLLFPDTRPKQRIIFTVNRNLTGIGFPRKPSKTEPIGWEDIKDMQSGTVERTIIDDTMPGGPIERTIAYEAPFDRCDREKDCEAVLGKF